VSSWNSSDLDSEFFSSKLKKKNHDDDESEMYATKLARYSQDFHLNKERLKKIQKILYTKKK